MKPTTPPTLYSVQGYKGAHLFLDVRDTEAGTIASVQLVGALLPIDVPYSQLAPFTQAEAMKDGDPITLLAQEAATIYNLDPHRIQKAAELARDRYAIQNARKDERGNAIAPSIKTLCVKSSKGGWYVVRPNFCTCPDHKRGQTCKHRIAAWIHREMIIRPLAQARKTTPAVILAELTA